MQDMICDCVCTYRKDGICELGIPIIKGDRRKGFCPTFSRNTTPKVQSDSNLIQ